MRRSFFLAALPLGLLGAFGCESIAGIEDRSLAAGADNQPSALCEEYCGVVMDNCKAREIDGETVDFKVYTAPQTCLDTCAALPEGDPLEPLNEPNSVACRLAEARSAEREPDVHCKSAGPGGGDKCGSDCEAWCLLLEEACPSEYAEMGARCEQVCQGLQDNDDFDLDGYYSSDTVECRLIHVGAAFSDPEGHCIHAELFAEDKCLPPEPDCTDVCRMLDTACTEDNGAAVYESIEQCVASCSSFEPGTIGDISENTIACRHYHAMSALLDTEHCAHAGPSGDGHCGQDDEDEGTTGNCDSYCAILEEACPEGFEAEGWEDEDDCQTACATAFAGKGAEGDSEYSVELALADDDGDELQCHLLQATRAAAERAESPDEVPSECAKAFPSQSCL